MSYPHVHTEIRISMTGDYFFLMPQAKKDLVLMIRITGNMSCRVLRREPWPIYWDFIYRKTPPPAGWSMDAQNPIIFCIITVILKNLMWNLGIIGTTHLDKSTLLGPKASLFNIKSKNVFSFNWDQTWCSLDLPATTVQLLINGCSWKTIN